jgi:hypothetical protein
VLRAKRADAIKCTTQHGSAAANVSHATSTRNALRVDPAQHKITPSRRDPVSLSDQSTDISAQRPYTHSA